MVQPAVAPQSATLTLYSLNDSNYYQYDLTSALSNTAAIGLWNNLTIPVGQAAQGWTSSGSPSWGNVTALQLTLNYPANSNITIRIGALFFRGQYQTPVQYNSSWSSAAVFAGVLLAVHFRLVPINRVHLPVL